MSDQQLMEMEEMFGSFLPDPIQFPKTFQYYIKLYFHIKSKQ